MHSSITVSDPAPRWAYELNSHRWKTMPVGEKFAVPSPYCIVFVKRIPVKLLPEPAVCTWVEPEVLMVVMPVTLVLSGWMPAPTKCSGLSSTMLPDTVNVPPLR